MAKAATALRTGADIEDEWQRKSTAAAIQACRDVVSKNGINGRAQVSSLSETEWGWLACAAIFAWIKTKSEQATEEGGDYDIRIRTMAGNPWGVGAVETILPKLAEIPSIDWSKPVGGWSKQEIINFALGVYRLVDEALALRDEGSIDKLTRHLNRDAMERTASELGGGPLMTREEMSEEVPF